MCGWMTYSNRQGALPEIEAAVTKLETELAELRAEKLAREGQEAVAWAGGEEWPVLVPMTREEIIDIAVKSPLNETYWLDPKLGNYEEEVKEITNFARAIEAHHNIGAKP